MHRTSTREAADRPQDPARKCPSVGAPYEYSFILDTKSTASTYSASGYVNFRWWQCLGRDATAAQVALCQRFHSQARAQMLGEVARGFARRRVENR